MNYIKITITTNPNKEWFSDVLIADYANIGFESFEQNNIGFNAYIPIKSFDENKLREIHQNYPDFSIKLKKEEIEDQNWNKVWEENYFQPLFIADNCVIRAPFHPAFPTADYEIIIEPNMAFGTGNHETTSLMMRAILETDIENKTVLDMGCGTGILSILSSMRRAKTITAIDINQWAYKATQQNCKINKIDNVTTLLGNAKLLDNQRYDIILSNIHKNIIVNDLKHYAKSLKNTGVVFLSGFYQKDLNDISQTAQENHLNFVKKWTKNDWIVAQFSF